jgi:magnesium transporter
MGDRGGWTDLLDPTEEEIVAATGLKSPSRELEIVSGSGDPRPAFFGLRDHAIGVFVVPVTVPEEDRVYYQEVDVVVTADQAVTVRHTPDDGEPFEPKELEETCGGRQVLPGQVVFHLVDIVAERYLDLIDDLNDEIDELEDQVEASMAPHELHRHLSELRHDMLRIRRTLAPTRDAVHRVVDGRFAGEAEGLIDPQEAARFGDVYDKLLRASDALELSRDLVAGVRDYHQAKVAQDQNEVVKKLTVIASLLLFPTFIVGVYGQNFEDMPELHWAHGYSFSWAVIVVSTLLQLGFFRWRKWI